ncbi:MAG TPA: polysaccharide deacetylase family protein, partial [Micromonosporaceae bacterium]
MNKTIWTLALATGAHALPSLTTITPMRMRLFPRLSGVGRGNHVALTFDDGPDPEYTPAILAHLEQLGVHATFFLLGVQARRHPARAREIVAAGHEVAVHGYVHRSLLRYGP